MPTHLDSVVAAPGDVDAGPAPLPGRPSEELRRPPRRLWPLLLLLGATLFAALACIVVLLGGPTAAQPGATGAAGSAGSAGSGSAGSGSAASGSAHLER